MAVIRATFFILLNANSFTHMLWASPQGRLVRLMRLLTPFTLLTICLTAIGFFLSDKCTAQSREIIASLNKFDSSRTVFYLPANTRLDQVPWRDSVYRFASFEAGRVAFATGYSPPEQVRMNYNLYFVQMDYISSEGDTLQIKPSKELKLISIGGHLFYHDQEIGYIEVIQQLPVALGVRNMMKVQYFDYFDDNRFATLVSNEDPRGTTTTRDRYYLKGYDYFFIGRNNRIYKTTLAAVLKLFPEHKKAVKTYIDEHDVDFERKEDLTNLLIFCNGLK
jgi:hypothetical protein